jgi:hypothetical protein
LRGSETCQAAQLSIRRAIQQWCRYLDHFFEARRQRRGIVASARFNDLLRCEPRLGWQRHRREPDPRRSRARRTLGFLQWGGTNACARESGSDEDGQGHLALPTDR